MVCYVGAQLDLGTAHDLHELNAEAAECSVSAESERQRSFKGKNRRQAGEEGDDGQSYEYLARRLRT